MRAPDEIQNDLRTPDGIQKHRKCGIQVGYSAGSWLIVECCASSGVLAGSPSEADRRVRRVTLLNSRVYRIERRTPIAKPPGLDRFAGRPPRGERATGWTATGQPDAR